MELVKYVLLTYPKLEELSKPRLVKLIYLIDWKYAIDNGEQATNIKWIYNHYGPYVDDVINLMKDNPAIFDITSKQNPYGGITDKFRLRDPQNIVVNLDTELKEISNLIIEKTSDLSWSNFISVVYSSFPVKSNLKYSVLDLKQLSIEFRNLKAIKGSQ
ncbi:Panacea domain-containing protein [Botryobacter ruber]|uniref:Panacea domain-containing protein n=1 Tax=Botryobacter ruber TaxID=2171629 RepID=UPI00196A4BE7|nr:Panacea domain-containing protein [Botryobacter ruber]